MALFNLSGIYQIRNLENGRIYIGSAVNLRVRKNLHWDKLRKQTHHTPPLQNAWNKYGEAAFVFEPLVVVPTSQLIEWEQRFLDFALQSSLYNCKKLAHTSLGMKRRPETLEKMRLASTGRVKSAETCAKLSAVMKGKAKSPEAIAKTAAARRGCKHSPETIAQYRETRKGRLFLTPEAIMARSKPYPAIVAPDGTTYPAGLRRAEFCRAHGLMESGFNKLCRGEQKSYRGWVIAKDDSAY